MSSVPPMRQNETPAVTPALFIATVLAASLTVKDLPASLAWYRDVLGFTVARTHDRGGAMFAASLRAGAVAVLLTQDDGAKGLDRAKGEGFSLQLTSEQDIDEIAQGIVARGGVIDSGPLDMAGARAFRFRDPDGFKFSVSSPRS